MRRSRALGERHQEFHRWLRSQIGNEKRMPTDVQNRMLGDSIRSVRMDARRFGRLDVAAALDVAFDLVTDPANPFAAWDTEPADPVRTPSERKPT